MDDEYTKREMDMIIHEIKDTLNQYYVLFTEITDRVKCLEGRIHFLEGWRDKLIGAVAVITVLIVPILINIIGKVLK
jgi:hypothetical protein